MIKLLWKLVKLLVAKLLKAIWERIKRWLKRKLKLDDAFISKLERL